MTAAHVGVYSPEDARSIRNIVLGGPRTDKMGTEFNERFKLKWHYVIMKEELAAASEPLAGYTQATGAVLMYKEHQDDLEMEEVVGQQFYLTITNRSPTNTAAIGDVVLVRWIIKEWVPIWTSGSGQISWGSILLNSGNNDVTQNITLYKSAALEQFIPGGCADAGSGSSGSAGMSFLDMDLELCETGDTVLALVPAGYKAGPVGLIKMPICGDGSNRNTSGSGGTGNETWEGWTVIFGRRLRCYVKIPKKIECCPTTGLIKITEWRKIWYFGEDQGITYTPCP